MSRLSRKELQERVKAEVVDATGVTGVTGAIGTIGSNVSTDGKKNKQAKEAKEAKEAKDAAATQYLQQQLEQLSNDVDYGFLSLTNKKCIEMNWAALAELGLSRVEMLEYMKKLKGYRYVDELQQLKCGAYLRWIPLTNPEEISLTHYGILCEIRFTPNILLVCKNFMHRYYSFYMDEAMIFQKLSRQELMLLSILDTLNTQAQEEQEPDQDQENNYKR